MWKGKTALYAPYKQRASVCQRVAQCPQFLWDTPLFSMAQSDKMCYTLVYIALWQCLPAACGRRKGGGRRFSARGRRQTLPRPAPKAGGLPN